jgi:hypothetical protein
MILPILFLFQLLFGGGLLATKMLVQMKENSFKKYSLVYLNMISQLNIEKVSKVFSLASDHYKLKMNHIGFPHQMTVHQELVPNVSISIREEPQEIPIRKHVIDRFKLYYPPYSK